MLVLSCSVTSPSVCLWKRHVVINAMFDTVYYKESTSS